MPLIDWTERRLGRTAGRITRGFVFRNPWATGVVALLSPVLVMLYLGRGRLALAYYAVPISIKFGVAAAVHFRLIPLEYGVLHDYRMHFDLLDLGTRAIGTFHAIMLARRMNGEIPQVWFARWYVTVLILCGIPIFIALIG